MSCNLRIRPAGPADAGVLYELERAVVNAPHWPISLYETVLRSPRHIVLAAESWRLLSGFIVASLAVDEVEIESIVVDAKFRRRGIGRSLVEALVDWSTDRAAARVFLEVRESNDAAQGLYTAMQFERVGVRPGYYTAPAEDAVVMRRLL